MTENKTQTPQLNGNGNGGKRRLDYDPTVKRPKHKYHTGLLFRSAKSELLRISINLCEKSTHSPRSFFYFAALFLQVREKSKQKGIYCAKVQQEYRIYCRVP
jgi:hypothetical protein